MNFKNLNIATPKDKYLMPIIDILVNSAIGNAILSFMNGYSRYNQIFIAEEDINKIIF